VEVIIREFKNDDLESLNNLLNEVYEVKRCGLTTNGNIELVAVFNNEIVGYTIINKLYNVIENCYYAHINYVCVLKEYRNKGIASKIFNEVFNICKEESIKYLELTSNSSRVEAHKLYKNLGFSIRETDVFRKELI